ncbi:MAG TPA: 50S ribosomal protein L10 [Bacteroidia bacterium]|jgi:large subunit ribosomal protein L10|nr:50S ribosomal protein L10 [Bacteroidia bacterium]
MRKEEKSQVIDSLVEQLANNSHFYLTDVSSLTAEKTSQLRRLCFNKNIKLLVVKNSLLQKAMERSTGKNYQEIIDNALKGSTAVMFSEVGSDPAKLIKQFREKNDRPLLKAAFVEESTYIGDNQLDTLASIKSKNELIGDIIGLLQSPAKNVISGLKASGGKLAGIVKTLSDRKE